MINLSSFGRLMEMLPAEMRLARRAKSGDVSAFVELCDQHVHDIYRYIYFLVPNNRVAEGLTVQVFFRAWEGLDRYPILETSFLAWLYSVARSQVNDHQQMHKNKAAPDNAISLATRGDEFREEFQSIRDAIQSLSMEQQQVLVLNFIVGMQEKDIAYFMNMNRQNVRGQQVDALCTLTGQLGMRDTITLTQDIRRMIEISLIEISSGASTLDASLLRHFKLAPQLEPILKTALLLQLGRDVKPTPAFETYTHYALVQYLRTRPRRAPIISASAVRRTTMALFILMAALLFTGTAYAQSALPGESFYGWKRASENLLHALSPNSITTDIFLAERRLHEWIAVSDDPELQLAAMKEYQSALAALEAVGNEENFGRIASSLQSQQEALLVAGISSPELNEYLAHVSTTLLNNIPPQTSPLMITTTATVTVDAPLAAPTDAPMDECSPPCKDQTAGNNNDVGNNNAGGIGSGNSNNPGDNVNNNGGGNDDKEEKDDNGGGNDDKEEKDNNGGGNDDKEEKDK